MNRLLSILRKIRAPIKRMLYPKRAYFFFKTPARLSGPLGRKSGFDRGTPIDRYYIDMFMERHKADVQGRCLEVHDDHYTKKFGDVRVTKRDVLDIDTSNTLANIYGDIRHLDNVPSNTYDCFIFMYTLGLVDDYDSAIREAHRILKPEGVLLFIGTVNGPIDPKTSFWHFTPKGVKRIFGKHFGEENLTIQSYGNALAGQAQWVGCAAEDLTKEELVHNDPHHAIIVGLRAVKKNKSE